MFNRVIYSKLKARQKEAFNFQKVSAILADFGYLTIRLSDDWRGADFIAQHTEDNTFLKIQLKSRLIFDKKYRGKNIYICFPVGHGWYLYPHDELLVIFESSDSVNSRAWSRDGNFHYPQLSKKWRTILKPYQLIIQPNSLKAF